MITEIEYLPGVTGDLYLPESAAPASGFPAVLLIHGGGWSSMDRSAVAGAAEMLCREGFAVFNIDYRLAPEHPWPAGLNDCQKALEHLVEKLGSAYGLDLKRIFVAGGSSGGHYALITGFTAPPRSVAGIVSISGIDDVYSDFELRPGRYGTLMGHPASAEELKEINPSRYFYEGAPPVLCTHFFRDTVVPVESCLDFAAELRRRGGKVTLYLYDFDRDGEGHAIWRPGTSPRLLYPDLEQHILFFLRNTPDRTQ